MGDERIVPEGFSADELVEVGLVYYEATDTYEAELVYESAGKEVTPAGTKKVVTQPVTPTKTTTTVEYSGSLNLGFATYKWSYKKVVSK